MEKVDTLVVDKTGTLTEGKPKLTEVLAAEGFDESELLRLAASLERASEHPLAAAIVDGAGERGLDLAEASDFASVTGKGVTGSVAGRLVALGNLRLLEQLGVDPGGLAGEAESRRGDAGQRRGDRGPPRRGPGDRHVDRRQPDHSRGRGPAPWP
jgi:Cu+-exporting ATPase